MPFAGPLNSLLSNHFNRCLLLFSALLPLTMAFTFRRSLATSLTTGHRLHSSALSAAASPSKLHHRHLPEETLYILDGTGLIFQSHFSRLSQEGDLGRATFTPSYARALSRTISPRALAALRNQAGIAPEDEHSVPEMKCSAVAAMANSFARFVANVKPKYVVAVFDTDKKSFRSEVLPLYKKQRPETPPDLIPQLYAAPLVLQALGCHCFSKEGLEADDVMASLGHWAREQSMHVVHVSVDKDMMQLIDQGVNVMNPRTMDVLGPEEVRLKFGVPPEQLTDLLALMGDSADNIPGAMGIGQRIAASLVLHFGSIDAMCQSLSLPEPSPEVLALSPSDVEHRQQLRAFLEQEKGAENVQNMVQSVSTALAKINMKGATRAEKVLLSLYHCGPSRLLLYKSLITLKQDVDMSTIDHFMRVRGEREGSEKIDMRPSAIEPGFFADSQALLFKGDSPEMFQTLEQQLNNISPVLKRSLYVLGQKSS